MNNRKLETVYSKDISGNLCKNVFLFFAKTYITL